MPKWTTEQQTAIDQTGSNIIVSAGAGSGKTAVLTARIGRILSAGVHIDELLILTFTKAAAGEMKDRIRKLIQKTPSLHGELDLIDSAYITTFDSFALSVVKKYHYLLNIDRNISITDSSIIDLQKKRIMEEVFQEYYTSDTPEFNSLISTFCVKDDKNLINAFLKIATSLELLPNKEAYLSNYLNTHLNESSIDTLLIDYHSLLEQQISAIKLSLHNYSTLLDGTYYTKLQSSFTNLFAAQDIDSIIAATNISLPQIPKGSDEEVKNYKEKNLTPLIKELKSLASYGTVKEIRANFEKSKSTIKILIDILTRYFQQLTTYKEENSLYDFQDIALLAIRIVAEFDSARQELKNKFKEIMIDEYQDTNDIQETFISYIENNNVYMVGDIKQSIYRFRNANPYIFKSKYDTYTTHTGGEKIDLLKNFRSRSEVLDNINEVFIAIMDDLIGGADYLTSHQMVFGNTKYDTEKLPNFNYNLRLLEYTPSKDFTNEEIEIFTVAKDIQEKINAGYQVYDKDAEQLRKATYSDFVILMDRATSFENYKQVFEYLHIPLTIYKDEKLTDSQELSIIKNALIFITKIAKKEYDVKFRYAYLSLARSFLYETKDDAIFKSFKNNQFTNTKIFQDFQTIAEDLEQKSITQILKSIIDHTNIYERLIKVGDITASIIKLTKLQELTTNLADAGYDIYTFIEYLESLAEEGLELKYSQGSTDADSVKIMTIHKSKGLEYPICYFTGLTKKFNIADIKERFTYDSKYGLCVPIFDEGITSLIDKELIKSRYLNEEISEKIRLFYVGLTRAREQLIIIKPYSDQDYAIPKNNGLISNTIRRRYNSFASIVDSLESILKKYRETIDIQTIGLSKDYLYPQSLNDLTSSNNEVIKVEEINIQTKLVEESSFSKKIKEPITKSTYQNINLGLKIHEILEYIDLQNYNPNDIEDTFIRNKITNLLNNPIFTNINNANIYQEHEFIYEKDGNTYHGIIDLLLEYTDHIDIIDYKLNNVEDAKYLDQLNGYKTYIENLTQKPTFIYLYSIIESKLKKLNE